MASCRISLCFLALAAILVTCNAVQTRQQTTNTNQPKVSIDRVNSMSPGMQLDASDFLKRAYSLSGAGDRCSIFRQLFAEKYTEYTWHVVMYKAYSVQYIKSIDLKVGDDYYLLFATKK